MLKYIFLLLIGFNILNAEDGVVKTSELELFLFKIGFESLLKDVDINKDKSTLNEKEIKTINEKIELIMNELYKDKRVLLNITEEKQFIQTNIDKKEFNNIKKEISFLKKEILELKNAKKSITLVKNKNSEEVKRIKKTNNIKIRKKIKKEVLLNKTKLKSNINQMRVATLVLAVYMSANTEAQVIRKIKRNKIIQVENCNNGWCKLKDENYFVRRYLIKTWNK